MADQRPFGRFRLPWLTAAAPRPVAEPQPPRPTVDIQAPAQPTTTIPQRPFRPGLASVQPPPPPQVQAPQRSETRPPLATTESQPNAQPDSLSSSTTQTRAAPQPRAASVPPSPTRTTPRSPRETVPQPQPSSQLAGRTSSQPSPPSRRTTQPQPTVSQPSSPPKKLQSTTRETFQPLPSAYQQEPKPAESSLSQAVQPTTRFKPFSEPTEKEKEIKEGKEVVEKLAEEESLRSAITELLAGSRTGSQTRELLPVAFDSEQKQQEKEDMKTTTIGSRTASLTHPKARSKPAESHQKPSMSNGERVPLHKEIRDDIGKFIHNLGGGKIKHPIHEKPISVVTVAGENTGASMHVGAQPARKDGSIHIHRAYNLNPDDSTGATTDGEGSAKGKGPNDPTKENPVTKAYVNSNAQSINNSIIFDSSVNEQNPGVHLAFSHNLAEQNKPSGKPEPLEAHKAEFNITPAQKLTYEPTIRRRCLRGLFLEPSDSDNDDPDKPRRHGCRYGCGEKIKDKDRCSPS